MSPRQETLREVARFCGAAATGAGRSWSELCSQTKDEAELRKELRKASHRHIRDVPRSFWSSAGMPVPRKPLDTLCTSVAEPSTLVLVLILWSWCSPECSEKVSKCLETGADQWSCTGDEFEWVRPYVSCAQMEMRLAPGSLKSVASDASNLETAVTRASDLFCLLTTQSPREVFFSYAGSRNLHSRSPSDRNPSDSNPSDSNPVMSWFKAEQVLPVLKEVARRKELRNFVAVMKAHTTKQKDWRKELEGVTERTMRALGFGREQKQVQFLAAVMLIDEFVQSEEYDGSLRQAVLMRGVAPLLGGHSEKPVGLLKKLIEDQPALFSNSEMGNYVSGFKENRCMTDEILRRSRGQSEKKQNTVESTPVVKDGNAVPKRKRHKEAVGEGHDRRHTDKVQTGGSTAPGRKGREKKSKQVLTGKGSDGLVEGAPPAEQKARAGGRPRKKKLNARRGHNQLKVEANTGEKRPAAESRGPDPHRTLTDSPTLGASGNGSLPPIQPQRRFKRLQHGGKG